MLLEKKQLIKKNEKSHSKITKKKIRKSIQKLLKKLKNISNILIKKWPIENKKKKLIFKFLKKKSKRFYFTFRSGHLYIN